MASHLPTQLLLKSIQTIELFKGSDDQDPTTWLQSIDELFDAIKISKADRRLFLPMYFGEDVKKWFRSENHNEDYDEFKKDFITTFTSSVQQLQIATKLMNRRQGADESVQAYHFDMLAMCARYNPTMTEDEKILYLVRGLKPSIQQHVILNNPKTCQDLFEHAKRTEAATKMSQPVLPSPPSQADIDETTAALRQTSINNTHRQVRSNNENKRYSSYPRWNQYGYTNSTYRKPRNQGSQLSFKLIRVPQDGSVTRTPPNPSQLIYIPISIDSIDARAMVDTGSTISAINQDYFRKLNHNYTVYSSTTSCKTANNTQLSTIGRVVLPITINNIQVPINVFIIENLCTELLLGNDFCNLFKARIDSHKRTLSIKTEHQYTKVSFLNPSNKSQVCNINTLYDITIPPLSGRVVIASTSAPWSTAIFTPSSKILNRQMIIAPHALVSIDNSQTTLTLMTPSPSTQTIKKGTKLGFVSYCSDSSCHYIQPLTVHDHQSISTIATDMSSTKTSTVTHIPNMISHLPQYQQKQILPILQKYQSVFDTTAPSLMKTNNVHHRIPVQPHHQPIQSYPYRKSVKETTIINEQVTEMLDSHIIRPSTSPWSSPVVIIKKKDGSPRFCVDYRRLNLITERDVYPLPRIDDILDKLAGSRYFTTFDLKAGYWQIPIAEEDKKKTAFITTDGLYEFNVLPFGLSNAPATFQRTINSVLGSLRWDITLVYLDDTIVYSPSFDQHIQHLDQVLCALHKANVKLNSKKCSLARKQLDYLGFRITQDGIKPTTANVKKTIDFPIPTTAKAAYSFVQMAQFYRRFIKDFASIAAPLNRFKIKNAKFLWTTECQRSFDILKQKLSQYPLLAFFDGQSPLKLKINTDASNAGIGGVLHQVTADGHLQPIQYLSRSLSKQEQKYSVIEKECLAMVWCISKLRPYLYGRDFTLITDHHPLCWLNKQSSKNGRLDRWSLQLQEYTFNIKYTSGSSNCVADCLSRYPTETPDNLVDEQQQLMHGQLGHEIMAILPTFDSSKIKEEQRQDTFIHSLYEEVLRGKYKQSYSIEKEVLFKIIHRPGNITLTVPYIPPSMINPLLEAYHDNPTAGHLGIHKTWHKIRDRYFWPGMYNQIKKYISSCTQCNHFKTSRTKAVGKLQPIEPPNGVLDMMGLDFVGPIPSSSSGNKYILVCTDYLSRYAITQATKNCTAETAAKFLVEQVILRFGVPRQLLTDRGSHFMSHVFEAIASRCGINHITTTTYHPQCNGLTERFNSTLVDSMGTYVNQQQSDWDCYLPFVTFAYNTAKQATIQMEPFKLMYGRDAILPFDVNSSISNLPVASDYYNQLIRFLQQAKSTAWYRIKQQQDIYKRTYDTGRKDLSPLQPNQLVFLKQMMPKHLKKFSPKYYGPFAVLRQIGRLNYLVKHVNDGHVEKVHVSRIRLIN
ncbi:unnamed protein product [Adineta ricciae]|uniref:RNA-directed DNA polymerase n=1 Tax=Adineta ricciae TaxID=249248 RepID=A0A814YMQ2_ADIRI|nr:unnamed protein product [Adineta ricciae]